MVAHSVRTISAAIMRVSLMLLADAEVKAVCTVRTCAHVFWLLRDFIDRCEDTVLDTGSACF
jgi:hypothetical protein